MNDKSGDRVGQRTDLLLAIARVVRAGSLIFAGGDFKHSAQCGKRKLCCGRVLFFPTAALSLWYTLFSGNG
jgi:hypothetical protein